MTDNEYIAIIIGLVLGYWFVAKLLKKAETTTSETFTNKDKFSYTGESDYSSPAKEWFNILEVPEDASKEQIAKAYKVKISQYHPDKVAKMGIEIRALAELKSKEINVAYAYAISFRK
jgi:DnaJ like chaperone protein